MPVNFEIDAHTHTQTHDETLEDIVLASLKKLKPHYATQ